MAIKFTNRGDTTIITADKDGMHVHVLIVESYAIAFKCCPSDLQRIVDMLNYVIKLNQDAKTLPG